MSGFTKFERRTAEFLDHSNRIEREYSIEAMEDATKAWDYLSSKKRVGVRQILKVHRILMKRLRPDIAGKWRTCAVYIGSEVKSAMPVEALVDSLQDFIVSINQGSLFKLDSEKEAYSRFYHVEFEKVHPFEDGNGRVGRMLYNWHRLQLGLSIHVIHEGAEQMAYYQWFKQAK